MEKSTHETVLPWTRLCHWMLFPNSWKLFLFPYSMTKLFYFWPGKVWSASKTSRMKISTVTILSNIIFVYLWTDVYLHTLRMHLHLPKQRNVVRFYVWNFQHCTSSFTVFVFWVFNFKKIIFHLSLYKFYGSLGNRIRLRKLALIFLRTYLFYL